MTVGAQFDELRTALGATNDTRWSMNGVEVRISFDRLNKPERSLFNEPAYGWDDRPKSWTHFLPFADILVEGGASPLVCLGLTDRRVYLADLERDEPICLLNCSIRQFANSLSVVNSLLDAEAPASSRLLCKLREIDREAYESGEWSGLVTYLAGVEDA